jgi:hypothetical protein
LFTLITTIFLPLIFFTSYFALVPGEASVRTHAEFWKYATGPTIAFMSLTLWTVFVKKHPSREDSLILRVMRGLRLLPKLPPHDDDVFGV